MKFVITKKDIDYMICFILFLPYLEPLLFKEVLFNRLNMLYTILKMLFLLVILIATCVSKRLNGNIILVVVFQAICAFSTIFYNGDFVKYCGPAVSVISMALITNYYFPKLKLDFFKLFYQILFVYMVINTVTIFFYPAGIILNSARSKVFFLGIENRFIFFLLPLTFFASVYSIKKHKKLNWLCITTIFVSSMNMFLVWSVGAVIGMTLFCVGIIFFSHNSKFNKMDFNIFLLVILLLNIGIVFFQIQNYLADFIMNVLHKDVSLTGRTLIWNNAIQLFKKYPVMGYGIQKDAFYALLYYKVTHPHNLFLNILTVGGIVGFIVYMLILLRFGSSLKNIKNHKIKFVYNLTVFVILILSLADTVDVGIIYVIYLTGMMYSGVMENE